jgi:hypothetical protein
MLHGAKKPVRGPYESFAAKEKKFAEENDGKERGYDVSDVFQVGGEFESWHNGCIMRSWIGSTQLHTGGTALKPQLQSRRQLGTQRMSQKKRRR